MSNNDNPQAPQLAALHAVITGRVHGVGFRVFILDASRRLRLGGWVRNTPEGSVEVYAVGERPKLEQLLASLRVGPPAASVKAVNHEWQPAPASGKPERFEVRN
jgi:acylphosphatase